VRGPIALVGGAEFLPPDAPLDAWLLERSGSPTVTVLPTAAREHPEMAVATARRHFQSLGGDVDAAMILTRSDAEDPGSRARLAAARFLYLAGGDPRYLLSVLRGTPAWEGMVAALDAGAVLAGSSAGAMVLCEWMLVPGSEELDAALGLVPGLVVLPHHDRSRGRLAEVAAVLARVRTTPARPRSPIGGEGAERTGPHLLGIDEATGLVLEDGGRCRVLGAGSATLYRAGPGILPPAVVWTREAPAELEPCL
jgi:cyanophycinase